MGASATTIAAAYPKGASIAAQIVDVSRRLGLPDPAMLANVINFESGFSPAARNPASGATGLIQFMPSTAARLGTSTDALARMSASQQMAYVYAYFAPYAGRLTTQADVYAAVFYPAAIGKGAGYTFSTSVQKANPGIRTMGDYTRLANGRAKLAAVEGLLAWNAVVQALGGTERVLWGSALVGGAILALLAYRRWRSAPALGNE